MDELVPGTQRCMTPDERRELQAAWADLRTAIQPFTGMVDHADEIDCSALHAAFLSLTDEFDKVEHLVMQAQQIRQLHAGHSGE